MLIRKTVVIVAMAAACAPCRAEDAPQFTVEKNVSVPMRDGVSLATDVYLPAAAGGKRSTILIRTPYNKGAGKSAEGKYFSAKGYAVVVQDTRGRYESQGTWHWLTDDGPDGVDCCAWIAQQPWSNGRIGMMGTSYVGGTQHAVAMAGSPHLKTIIPVDAVSNMGRQSMRNAGAFEMRFWNWIMLNAGKGSRSAQDEGTAAVLKEMADQRHDYLKLQPPRPGTTPLKLAPEYESWLIEAMRHGKNDAFWEQNAIVDHPEKYSDIPVYLVGGWYDSWAGNTTANFMALSRRLKSDVYLIMGPWIHGAQGGFSHGQVTFGKEAAIADPLAWRKVWFDRYLNDENSGVGTADPFKTKVRIFVMGTGDGRKNEKGLLNHGGSWRNENEWPLARAVATPLYLHNAGVLKTTKPTASPSSNEAATSFQFDPSNPVPTIGGNISSQNDIMLQGGWDQKGGSHVWNWQKPIPLSARNDILVFQTEPLAADTEVTGEIEVKLWISSTAVDTDFTAKLIDVYPPSVDFPGGFDLNIGDGIVRARFRDSLEEEKLMEPGKVYPVTVKLYPTSNVFKKGHRIRVDISSSNFPRFDVNPNTGEPLAQHRRMETCVNTVYHDADRPSQITLPVIPSSK
jgi:putative CocE/NonD family hydrolase